MSLTTTEISGLSEDNCTTISSVISTLSLSVIVAVTVAAVPLPSPIISTFATPATVDELDSTSVPAVVEKRTTSSPDAPFSVAFTSKVARSLPARILSPLAASKVIDKSTVPEAACVQSSSPAGARIVPPQPLPPLPPLQAVSTSAVRQTRKIFERESAYIGAPSASPVRNEHREFIII